MNFRILMLFVAMAVAVVWLVIPPDKTKVAEKPVNLLEGQQRQMQKAKNLGDQMQKDLDDRMKSVPGGI